MCTHEVVIDSGGGYRIESKEADETALREIESLTNDIGAFLHDFIGKTLNIVQPFSLVFDFQRFTLSEADALVPKDAAVKQMLDELNQFLVDEEAGLDAKLPGNTPASATS